MRNLKLISIFVHSAMLKKYLVPIFLITLIIAICSCKKEDFTTDSSDKLEFSTDDVIFDTVFVSLGSVTKNFRVFNNNNRPIRTSVKLAGSGTNYRLNVNGVPGRSFKDVEIRANDSIWVFVEVTVDPSNATNPYILADSIIFETNGNIQDVDLAAWGQNAHFIVADKFVQGLPPYALIDTALNKVITWNDSLPYVIYGGFAVVDSTQTLIILQGTQIHFGNNAGLWVYKGGTLKVTGSLQKPVVFQGLRRESSFADEPGQWDRIWINDGGNNEIDYAIIKNGFIGLQTETLFNPQMTESLKLTNTIIKNMAGFGIFARNFVIEGYNNVIANCGLYCAAFTVGGSYDFTHCTFANYWKLNQRSTPVMYMNNYAVSNGNAIADNNTKLEKADFKNCIIFGTNDNELELDLKPDTLSNILSNHLIQNCVLKTDNNTLTTDQIHFTNIFNVDPGFKDTDANNYELSGTGAENKGNGAFITGEIRFDLLGIDRSIPPNPDPGAYEKQ